VKSGNAGAGTIKMELITRGSVISKYSRFTSNSTSIGCPSGQITADMDWAARLEHRTIVMAELNADSALVHNSNIDTKVVKSIESEKKIQPCPSPG
jgi:hypothetical protein